MAVPFEWHTRVIRAELKAAIEQGKRDDTLSRQGIAQQARSTALYSTLGQRCACAWRRVWR